MQSDVCMSMSREAVAWLDNLDTTETTDHGDCQITLKAIEDLHESQARAASLTSQGTLQFADAGDWHRSLTCVQHVLPDCAMMIRLRMLCQNEVHSDAVGSHGRYLHAWHCTSRTVKENSSTVLVR